MKAAAAAAKPPRTQAQGVQLLGLALKSIKVAALLLAVWLIGYLGFSVTWVLIALICYVVGEEYKKTKEAKRAYVKQAVEDEQGAILARVDELPAWVGLFRLSFHSSILLLVLLVYIDGVIAAGLHTYHVHPRLTVHLFCFLSVFLSSGDAVVIM